VKELKYLKEALEIEKEALVSAEACYEYYKKIGDNDMAESMKEIWDDEKNHVEVIQKLVTKLEK